jgi:LysR family transcriptional regulator, hydrogen peroxide-inducible genes activator
MLLRQLKYAVAVQKLQSFTKGADYCCITQPTLSQQISELEGYLSITLFDRDKKPIEPTVEGYVILRAAEDVIEKCNALEDLAKQLVREKSNKPDLPK